MSPTLEEPPPSRGQASWTPEMVADLRRGIAFGLTSGVIAAQMGITRNAVIGKARRLHLSLTPRKPPEEGPPPRRSRIKLPPTPPPPPSGALAPGSIPVEIWDLTDFTCRWPVAGDHPPFWYCGAPTTPREGVYCPCHRRLSLQPSRSSPAS
jgi:GcrA cell cycle regulator